MNKSLSTIAREDQTATMRKPGGAMQPIHQKELADITWADLEALVSSGVAEGPNLEFKRTLADPNGGDDPWIKGQDRIGRHARDELAREIVAFANAYGGLLLLGVEEAPRSNGTAQALVPLPRCSDLSDRLERAIGDMVDPPLPGFYCRAIPSPSGDGTGVVALRVSASSAAPHGYSEPPQTYVRRGTSATPLTMRDLQAIFWDARTRRERIEQIRAEHQAKLRSWFEDYRQGLLLDRDGKRIPISTKGLFVRASAIPQQHLEIVPFPFDDWRMGLRPSNSLLGSRANSGFNEGQFGQKWTRTAHGAWAVERGPANWNFRDDGTVSVLGFRAGFTGQGGQNLNFHSPGRYVAFCAHVMVIADRMRRRAGRPDIPIELDLEFLHDGSAIGGEHDALTWGDDIDVMLSNVSIGPVLLASRSEFANTFLRLEAEIWHAFGATSIEASGISFERAFTVS